MSETTSCGGEGNDYINGTKKAYKGWVDVEKRGPGSRLLRIDSR